MDTITAQRRSENMRRIGSKDTGPELVVRRLLHGMGYRYRLHRNDLPGRPDIVFPGRKKVVLVHGCFWHQHHGCQDGRMPTSRPEYWAEKLTRNKARDMRNRRALARMGWSSIVIWECDIRNEERLTSRLSEFLG